MHWTSFIWLFLILACGCRNRTIEAKLDQICAWNNCPNFPTTGKENADDINVHLICHTHDDLGWIINVDEYFSRLRPELVPVGVEYIFNTVLIELERDPTKRFSFAETGFLMRWMESHDFEDNTRLKKLILNGQIELIGGGWVQPDEATSHYVELIDQYTLGLRKLNETFGECGKPKVAWQIDPFGHSREHANIVVDIGFEALFFARLHYLEHQKRLNEKTLEFVWSTSDDLKSNQILTGQFYQGNYGAPPGYCFDALCKDKPIVTAPQLQGYNIHEKTEELLDFIRTQAKNQRHRNVMLLMGGDFQYSDANQIFTNIDKLVKAANKLSNQTKINLRYSTPSCYVKSLSQAEPRLPQRDSDIFPYATGNHSYWTGFFSSKPVLKGLIRSSSNFLQLVRVLDAFSLSKNDENGEEIETLERAVGLSQHHDAVTGTSKENVTQDYESRLLNGWNCGQSIIQKTIKKLSNIPSNVSVPRQTLCLLINESVCPLTKTGKKLSVTVYNSNSQNLETIVRVPFYFQTASVKNSNGENIDFDLKSTFLPSTQLKNNDSSPFEIQFPAKIPALGFKTFYIFKNKTKTEFIDLKTSIKIFQQQRIREKRQTYSNPASTEIKINNEFLELLFDSTGRLKKLTNLKTKFSQELTQEFLFYESQRKNFTLDQSSGAYIFRPVSDAKSFTGNISIKISQGKYVQEIRQVINPWISQVVRLFANQSFVEFDWIIGPILKEEKNPIGREIITRYTTKIQNDGIFYTDSNGRQMLPRKRNNASYYTFETTEPIAANYFPVPTRIQITDKSVQLTILTDRSQGGSSLIDGQVELMLHRRIYEDDGWGVEEPLNEPGNDGQGLVVRGKHWLIFESTTNSQKDQRKLALELFHQPIVTFFTSQQNQKKLVLTEFSGLLKELPENIHILTLKRLSESSILLRLEHFFQNGEDETLAQPAVVDLDQIFSTLNVLSVEELLLAANAKTGSRKDIPLSWNRPSNILTGSGRERFAVQLQPMEIKTLLLEVRYRKPFPK